MLLLETRRELQMILGKVRRNGNINIGRWGTQGIKLNTTISLSCMTAGLLGAFHASTVSVFREKYTYMEMLTWKRNCKDWQWCFWRFQAPSYLFGECYLNVHVFVACVFGLVPYLYAVPTDGGRPCPYSWELCRWIPLPLQHKLLKLTSCVSLRFNHFCVPNPKILCRDCWWTWLLW